VQNLRLGSRRVETRLLMRHTDGEWAGYTYAWNNAGTDAERVVGGRVETIAGQTWEFPSESQCLACHRSAAGRSLGLELAQLNRSFTYPATGRTANQVLTLNAIGMFSPTVDTPPSALPSLPDPFGTSATTAARARAYLHAVCAHCHRPGGGTPSDLDLRYATALADTNACDRAPQAGDLGIADARLIAPGSAARSVLVARVNRRDADGMPPLVSRIVDSSGVQLLAGWIDSLAGCN
jgi:mono/diheme cytochrome c family protein